MTLQPSSATTSDYTETATSSEVVVVLDDDDTGIGGTTTNAHSHRHSDNESPIGQPSSGTLPTTRDVVLDAEDDNTAVIALLSDIVKIRATHQNQTRTANIITSVTTTTTSKAERTSTNLPSQSLPGSYALSPPGHNSHNGGEESDDDTNSVVSTSTGSYSGNNNNNNTEVMVPRGSSNDDSLCIAQSITAATVATEREMIYKEVMETVTSTAVVADIVSENKRYRWMTQIVLLGIATLITVGVIRVVRRSKSINTPPLDSSTGMMAPTSATMVPSSAAPTSIPRDEGVFYTTEELYEAIDAYLIALNITSTPIETSDVALQYGYPVNTWNVSLLTNFSRAFDPSRPKLFDPTQAPPVQPSNMSPMNEDLSAWDVSNAVTMYGMFAYARSFEGLGIENWDTRNVQDMSFLFFNAKAFNNTKLHKWNTSSVTSMHATFCWATSFAGDISTWDVSSVTNMYYMFGNALQFTGTHLELWDVSNVQDMSWMFAQTESFNGNVSGWNTSQVVYMNYMFSDAFAFNGDLSSWSVGNVVEMDFMLSNEAYVGDWDLTRWDTSHVTRMQGIFLGAVGFMGNVSTWDVSKVIVMEEAFSGCTNFNGDLSKWNTRRVENMKDVFAGASKLTGNLSTWNTSKVSSMRSMFEGGHSFNSDISMWDLSSVRDAAMMFSQATSFNQSLCEWRKTLPTTASVSQMFESSGCVNENYPVLSANGSSFCHPCQE